ncbi:ADP-ribosylglycohydrolase [Kitasatospora acidiphila]
MTDQSHALPLPSSFEHRAAAGDSLCGLAVGDGFGAQFFVPEDRPALDERRLPTGSWPWTDDTEMACSVFDGPPARACRTG